MNKEPKFYTSSGALTAYSFACGYVEKQEKHGHKKQMYREHNCFHVRAGKLGEYTEIWEVFDDMKSARKYYNSMILRKKGVKFRKPREPKAERPHAPTDINQPNEQGK